MSNIAIIRIPLTECFAESDVNKKEMILHVYDVAKKLNIGVSLSNLIKKFLTI